MRLTRAMTALLVVPAVNVLADVFSYECDSFPVPAGWELLVEHCNPEHWLDGGWLYQHVGAGCPKGPNRGQYDYRRFTGEFAGEEGFFIEWELEADGDRSEIPGVAPAALTANSSLAGYHVTIARDQVRFIYDLRRPTTYIDIEPDTSHTYRLEILGDQLFIFYIDGEQVLSEKPMGPYTLPDARIQWRAKSWYLENTVWWDYIRYGTIPQDASGDYDSDEDVDLDDYYYVHECFSKSGPDVDAGSGCRFADFDGDTDVDLKDLAAFQNAFTGDEP